MMRQESSFKNIIVISKDNIILKKEDNSLEVSLSDKLDFYDITKMNIEVKKDTSLLICYSKSEEIKLDMSIIVNPNVSFDLFETKETENTKIQNKYYIYENGSLNINKFYDEKIMKELDIFYLNGNGAYITSTIKGILTGDSSIDMIIYHNYPNTKSNIENKLVTVKDGKVKLNVTTIVYNKIKNCNVNQSNFILKENNLDSTIKPILLIEENEVEASHSAHISSIDPNQLYYIESRGIKEYDAKKLYIKGFLKGDFYNIENNIEKYWR